MSGIRAILCAILLAGVVPAQAQTSTTAPPAATPAPGDYSNDASWLCRPGRTDACAQDQTATVVAADGTLSREAFTPDPNAPIDCFYVYPTVSLEPTGNADLAIGPAERAVAGVHLARFTSQCHAYAPVYRQMTLAGLRAVMSGQRGAVDRGLAYNDVLTAWRYYLAHDNNGRGVVLIGHSQGAGILIKLIHDEIDGKPVQQRLVSALILGGNVIVPHGANVGGSFQHIPACRATTQTGCVISYVSFRENAPPPANAFFGKPYDIETGQTAPGMVTVCTNPGNLAGGLGVLYPYFHPGVVVWTTPPQPIATPYVSVPGLVSAHCVSDEHGTYLAIHVNADPTDPRTNDIPGDLRVGGEVQADWGLHLIDIPEAQGDLVDIVREQGAAYAAQHH